jgi:long-chain acyl-CoA synthetase
LPWDLLAMGYEKGDKIATVTTNRPEWNFADMGMAMIGVFMCPFILPLEMMNTNTFWSILNPKCYLIADDSKLFEKLNPIARRITWVKGCIILLKKLTEAKNFEEILKLGESSKGRTEG